MRLRILVAATAMFCLSLVAKADSVTYTLINSPTFTTVTGAYNISDKITGSFTLANPIAPNSTGQTATPTSYSFFDGLNTFTNLNSLIDGFFALGTDASGNITQYQIGIESKTTLASFLLQASGGFRPAAANGNSGSGYDFANVLGGNASFQTSAAVSSATPEPSSLALLGTGVLGLVGMVRRRMA